MSVGKELLSGPQAFHLSEKESDLSGPQFLPEIHSPTAGQDSKPAILT